MDLVSFFVGYIVGVVFLGAMIILLDKMGKDI